VARQDTICKEPRSKSMETLDATAGPALPKCTVKATWLPEGATRSSKYGVCEPDGDHPRKRSATGSRTLKDTVTLLLVGSGSVKGRPPAPWADTDRVAVTEPVAPAARLPKLSMKSD